MSFICLSLQSICNAQTSPAIPIITPPTISVPEGIMKIPFPSVSPYTQNDTQNKTTNNDNKNSNNKETEKDKQTLTAANIASLVMGGNSSLLGNIFGQNAHNLNDENASSEHVLQDVLKQLEQIQKNTDTNVQSQSAVVEQNIPVSIDVKKQNQESKILRFKVNGYSILDTCKTIFFSSPTQDGDFLLTGDRKYISSGIMRDETFYMYFKKINESQYQVATQVIQDYLNEYSFLYQLSKKISVIGEKTGNMIVVRIDETVWKLDMLIEFVSNQL